MSKIYKNQSALRFTFSTGADITGHTLCSLEVTYPQASTATWTCTVSDASTGAFYYDFVTTSTLKTTGTYLVQAKITFSDDTVAYSETQNFIVYGQFK